MEVRARYLQVGVFTLAVIVAGFVFVYWLNTATGLRSRSTYQIRFESSVAGLLTGSAVLFNGIRVGEVTRLELDPAFPRRVLATIAVDRTTPVRQDTLVTIDFQGLTGSPVIALKGGNSTEALVVPASGVPMLLAASDAGQSMSGAARDVLRRLDTILEENATPLKSMIGNLDTFAGALARNSDKLDDIVAGLERMTGGANRARLAVYDLAMPAGAPTREKAVTAQLVIADPTALSVLDSDRIQNLSAAGSYAPFTDAQWGDLLPKVVQMSLVRAFDDASLFAGISRPLDGVAGDLQLLIDIRKFALTASLSAEVELGAKLLDGRSRIVATRVLRDAAQAEARTGPAAAAALNKAFGRVGAELMTWTAGVAAELSQRKAVVPK